MDCQLVGDHTQNNYKKNTSPKLGLECSQTKQPGQLTNNCLGQVSLYNYFAVLWFSRDRS